MNVLSCTRACAAADNLQQSDEAAISRLIFVVVVEFHLCPRVSWDPFVLSWAEAVVCSAFTLCSSVNCGHLNRIPAPTDRVCLVLVVTVQHLLSGGTHRSHTYMSVWPLKENSWLRLLNTLLKPGQESLELTEMEYATVFGRGLLSKVSSAKEAAELSGFGNLKF